MSFRMPEDIEQLRAALEVAQDHAREAESELVQLRAKIVELEARLQRFATWSEGYQKRPIW